MIAKLAVVGALLISLACSAPAPAGGGLNVVAGENFWGSVATQLGGSRVKVQTVVSDPAADPHDYESTASDARAFATADLVILNGAGYDDWGRKLLAAGGNQRRQVLVVAEAIGKSAGDNPHFWYDPAAVARVADTITARYRALDPADAAYFDQQRAALVAAFKPYDDRVIEIRQRFGGTRIGATENVFAYMATALGLNLVTDPAFMQAVAEGNDPPTRSVASFQDQIAHREIRILVYNVQTATAVTTNLKQLAAAQNIPVVGVSETLQPEGTTFQAWQLTQLVAIEAALATPRQA